MPAEELYDVFISYGRSDDTAFVKRLYDDLIKNNCKIWYDKTTLESNGLSFLQNIRDNLALNNKRLILVIGPHAAKSDFVKFEWQFALANCMIIIPVLRLGNETGQNGEIIKSDKDYELIPYEIKKRNYDCIDFRGEDTYENGLKELLHDLSKTITPLATLYSVPDLPANFISRNNEVEKLKEIIMADNYIPGIITSVAKSTAVYGMGGIGKSILAAALCQECDVRRSFSDGVRWVRLGQNPDLKKAVQEITGDNTINLIDSFTQNKNKLNQFLLKKKCLIVLDDVWKQNDIEIFRSDENLLCRLLVTTRNKNAVGLLSGNIIEIGLLNSADAKLLLHKSAILHKNLTTSTVPDLPPEADEIIEQCGHLPLAIAMAGGMISSGDKDKWKLVLQCLKNADLKEINKLFPDYPYPNLFRVLDASVKFLEQEGKNEMDNKALQLAKEKYFELGIFKEDTKIPKQIIQILWQDNGFGTVHVDNLLDILLERSLIQRNEEGEYSLHDLQVDYLQKITANLKTFHSKFIRKLGDPLKINHSYAWNNYVWHLVQASKEKMAISLLRSFEWIKRKLFATDVYSLINDYEHIERNEALDLIYRALKLSSQILTKDKHQLLPQLWGRLNGSGNPVIKRFLKQALPKNKAPLLRSLVPDLTPPSTDENFIRFELSVSDFCVVDNTIYCPASIENVYEISVNNFTLHRKCLYSEKPLSSQSVSHILFYRQNLIFVTSDGSIYEYDYKNGTTKSYGKRIPVKGKTIILDNCIYVGSRSNSLYVVDLENPVNDFTEFVNQQILDEVTDFQIKRWERLKTKLNIDDYLNQAINRSVEMTSIAIFNKYVACGYDGGHLSFFNSQTKKWDYSFFDKQDTSRIAFILNWVDLLITVHRKGKIDLWFQKNGAIEKKSLINVNLDITWASIKNNRLYLGSYDGDLCIYDLNTGQTIQERIYEKRFAWIGKFENLIICISDNNIIKIYAETENKINLTNEIELSSYFEKAVINNGTLFILTLDYRLRILPIVSLKKTVQRKNQQLKVLGNLGTIQDTIFGCYTDSTVKIWRLKNGKEIHCKNSMPRDENVSAFKSIKHTSFFGSESGNVYEMGSGLNFIPYVRPYSERKDKIEFITAQNKYLLTGSNSGRLDLWDTKTKSHIRTLFDHEKEIRNIHTYKEFIISTSDDRDHFIWNSKTQRSETKNLGYTYLRKIEPFTEIIVCGYSDGLITVYDIENNALTSHRLEESEVTCIFRISSSIYVGLDNGSVFLGTKSSKTWKKFFQGNSRLESVKSILTIKDRLIFIFRNGIIISKVDTGSVLLGREFHLPSIAVATALETKLLLTDIYSVSYVIDISDETGPSIICKYYLDTFISTPIYFLKNRVFFGDNDGFCHLLQPLGFLF